ncbi:unconventional myosin-XIX isoform X2 [Ambystoma mexicanum]|uniref:unconventional myosin-XIX isoform X2 n=1 Tax=Ambystoma mexicanum TaxID=8296 RepID=UPI0037E94E66
MGERSIMGARAPQQDALGEERQNGPKRNLVACTNLNDSLEEEVRAFLIQEDELHEFDDLTKVNPVNTTTVLKCLQARYKVSLFYTNAGCTLVAVNPFRPVFHLYTPELMNEYHTASHPQELKPHVFIVAEQAYRNVQSQIQPVDQSIIVSGESGAGKTWTSRCLMKYYATVAASCTSEMGNKMVERIERRVLDSNPVMEAFGNACTMRNTNSSRFGKYIQLQLNSTQLLTGASIQTYLLEKTRVAHQAPLERNFHIFYQITKGASTEERRQWNLPEGAMFYWLPNPDRNLEEDCFEVTRDAMLHLGIDSNKQNNIFKLLAGLLHLGNVNFEDTVDESQPCELQANTKSFLVTAASLLNVSLDELRERLQVRTITAGKQQQVFLKPCSKSECAMRRDCLAKVVYAKLFDWLVMMINGSICADSCKWTNFIGLLDVYGFESFPENSLEQLCINYANEKLQQHFVSHYLKAQQEEYAAEGLEWSFISYQDNQGCVDLIDGSPISIFSLLNEECRLNRSSDAKQLQVRLEKALANNQSISRDKFSKKPHFIVAHYAGRVSYLIEEMAEKNKDPVPAELIQLLQESQDDLLQKLFPAEQKGEADSKKQNRTTVVTVVSKFKNSLESLMQILHSTTPHYIRCIKPNMDCKAMTFTKEEVLSQLEACGIVETINISAAGFPIRVSFQNFIERYQLMRKRQPFRLDGVHQANDCCPSKKKRVSMGEESNKETVLAVHDILENVLSGRGSFSSFHNQAESKPCNMLVHCGRTKVFITHPMLDLLEARRAAVFSAKAFCIQCCWRRYKQKKIAKREWAAIVIQAAVKSWLIKKMTKRMHHAATVIKHAWRKWRDKMEVLAALELDDTNDDLGDPVFSVPGSPARASHTRLKTSLDKAWAESVALQFWPVGLVLSTGPAIRNSVSIGTFDRDLSLLMCLKIVYRSKSYKMETNHTDHGIASIRALPQGSVKFHYKKSPLLYANTCPKMHRSAIDGFNEILLEKTMS